MCREREGGGIFDLWSISINIYYMYFVLTAKETKALSQYVRLSVRPYRQPAENTEHN